MKNLYFSSGKKWLVAVIVMATFMFGSIVNANAQHLAAADGESGIQEKTPALALTAMSGDVTIKVNAEAGILPEGTHLSVKLLSDKEEEIYVKSLKENNGIRMSQSLFYDITLFNKQGREIQPNGEVTVSFSGLNFDNDGTGLVVLHAEENVNGKEGFFFSKKYPEINTRENRDIAQYASLNPNEIQFKTSHFSVYAVGTTQTATYNFMVSTTLQQTQIVLNGESLIEPETPTALSVPRSRTSVLRSKVLHAVNEMVEAVVSRTTSVAVQAEALNHQMVLR